MDSEESCDGEAVCGMPGGIQDRRMGENDAEMEELGRFAVDEHNKQQNTLLEFAGVVNAKEQVVAGTMYYLTVEAIEGGKKKLYEAKVWVKPWLNFKELQEFTPLADSSSGATAADLGAKQDEHGSGWRTVPPHDPVVKDAANHAVKTIQQRSNSLAAYELLEILHSKAEMIEDLAKFDLLLKLRRGSKEEKYKVEVHKNLEGNFQLYQMQEEL
ncbi:cysteine proteinase inhibitor 12-like isoform X2 [Asparagus officinalis]|uniref:cysteine proteinase inhibitor 12-like isoform X2 n=1 Tax=Asparagus officinalis TaxID=4686 RepID=UPI00098DE49D|nr:cysteine proteinase inhibitor 12-like isoform X2 [Asparagus officinalis]